MLQGEHHTVGVKGTLLFGVRDKSCPLFGGV